MLPPASRAQLSIWRPIHVLTTATSPGRCRCCCSRIYLQRHPLAALQHAECLQCTGYWEVSAGRAGGQQLLPREGRCRGNSGQHLRPTQLTCCT